MLLRPPFLFQKKDTGEWMTGSPQKPEVLSEEQALEVGKTIRDALIKGVDIINNATSKLEVYELYRITEFENIQKSFKQFFNLDFEIDHAEALLNNEKQGEHHPNNLQLLLKYHNGKKNKNSWNRFTFDEQHFYVDLVFYNRLLQCYVLIDLKIERLTHQDLGQMQMYVNYYDRHVKQDFEKPTIGILLCKEKNDALVELTLPKDANIYASAYQLYLPNKALLQAKVKEWIEEFEESEEEKQINKN